MLYERVGSAVLLAVLYERVLAVLDDSGFAVLDEHLLVEREMAVGEMAVGEMTG